MFTQDPFDIAPAAPRYTRASWLVLAIGMVFAGLCTWPLVLGVQASEHARESTREARQLHLARAEKAAAFRLTQGDRAVLDKVKAQQTLQRVLRMSWSALFDAIESAGQAVDGGAVILSLVPVKAHDVAAQVDITAMAVSTRTMVDYIRALERDSRVSEVQLSTQQPALSAGTEVVRFQLSMMWNPHARPSQTEHVK